MKIHFYLVIFYSTLLYFLPSILFMQQSYAEIETKKVKRKSSITKNEHFRNLLSQAYNNKVLFEWVLADNWLGAKENLEY